MARIIKLLKSHMVVFIVVTFLAIQKTYKKVPIVRISRFVVDMKHILLWTKIRNLEDEGQKYFLDHKCEYINCYMTVDRNLLGDVRYFDTILFNLQDVSANAMLLPKLRSWTQKYVFVANDSSDNFPVCNYMYDDFFNWTWTYRYDSTIKYRFFTVYNEDYQELGSHFQWNYNMKPIDLALKSQFVTKSKAAVIFLDKCGSRSDRLMLINNLNTNLAKFNHSVDIYGKCGSKQCKRKTMNPCFWRLKKNYYFYLAFEDSVSYDYVTDVVLYGYKNNAVPIVYGGARYAQYLPPGSYLSAQNMSVESLAKQMYDIISNKNKYYNFFRWRNYYTITKTPILNACALCATLNNPARLGQVVFYENFRKWWNPYYKLRCKNHT